MHLTLVVIVLLTPSMHCLVRLQLCNQSGTQWLIYWIQLNFFRRATWLILLSYPLLNSTISPMTLAKSTQRKLWEKGNGSGWERKVANNKETKARGCLTIPYCCLLYTMYHRTWKWKAPFLGLNHLRMTFIRPTYPIHFYLFFNTITLTAEKQLHQLGSLHYHQGCC